MKFLVVCMFALAATSNAGQTKKEKRGLLHENHGLQIAPALAAAPLAPALAHSYAASVFAAAPLANLGAAPAPAHSFAAPALATSPLAAAPALHASSVLAASALAHHASLVHERAYISSAPIPASTVQQVAQHVQQHTHVIERVNIPVPYQVDRTVVKHIPVDRPVPQPYPVEVIKHIPQPYTVDRIVLQPYEVRVQVPVPKPFAVPVDRVQTIVEKVPVPHPVAVDRPASYPVYVQQQQAVAVHAAPASIQNYHKPTLALHATPSAYAFPALATHGHYAEALLAAAPALDLDHHHHHHALAHHF